MEPAQIGVIKDIQKSVITNCVCPGCCKTKPDLIVFSIGGNDMEFSNTIKALVFNVAQNEFSQAPARLKQLQLRFDKLSEAFKDIGTSPAGIFFVEYFDLVKNSKGYSDTSCGVVGQADSYNFDLAETQIRKPMNDIIVAVCQKNNWTYIQGIDTLFLAHGVCSSDAYIGSVTDSLSIQGDWNGAFHPNYKGHQLIAPIVWRNVSQYLTKIMYNI